MEFTAGNDIGSPVSLRTNKSAPTSMMTKDSKTTTQRESSSQQEVCYLCSTCGKSFGSRKALAGHQKAHTRQIRWSWSMLTSTPSAHSVIYHRNSSSMIPRSSSRGGSGFVKPVLGVGRDSMIHKQHQSLIIPPPPYLWPKDQMQYWRWQPSYEMRNNPNPMAVVQPNITLPVHPGATYGSELRYHVKGQRQEEEDQEIDLTLKL